jgi:hypothetical protein
MLRTSELVRNRISDSCDVIGNLWNWSVIDRMSSISISQRIGKARCDVDVSVCDYCRIWRLEWRRAYQREWISTGTLGFLTRFCIKWDFRPLKVKSECDVESWDVNDEAHRGTSSLSTTFSVNSIYCAITVNHRLTGPGKMVKLCLLFVGKFPIQKFDW